MELYTKIVQQCAKYGCNFKHTIGQDFKVISRCGHESIVSPNQFMKYKVGVYCVDCFGDILFQEIASCVNCAKKFIPTETKFLFCSPSCASSISMTDQRKISQREFNLKKNLLYLNDDGSLKSDEEIEQVRKNKKRKATCITKQVGETLYNFPKKGKFVDYIEIKNTYELQGCKLLTTEDEYMQMKQTKPLKSMWFNIVSVCGHQEKSLYYSFTESRTCLYCKRCTLIRARELLIGQAKTDDGYGNSLMTQKLAIDIVKQKCQDMFDCIKTRDGCDSDLLIRPKGSTNDCWLKLKIKSTIFGDGNISFRIGKIHQSIYLMISITTQEIWLFDPENIQVRTYYMKQHKHVYDDNFIKDNADLSSRLSEKYTKQKHIGCFDELNNPISPAMKLEYSYVLKREKCISFLKFDRNEITGSVYNFKVGNLKFQENVVSQQTGKTSFVANISKNSRQQTRKPYAIGDNDFYWINLNDQFENFYVIPERVMISNGLIETSDNIGHKHLSICANPWVNQFKFNYKTINTEHEKQRLLCLIRD